MGKGDLRSKRGKIHRGTFGNTRLRKKKRPVPAPETRDKQDGYGTPPAPRPVPPG
jgi:ribosomal small subunit protein bTHX